MLTRGKPIFAPLTCLFLLAPGFANSTPFRPSDDAQVLERLPTRLLSAEQQTLGKLRSRLAEAPDNAESAAELAERYYRLAQRTGDPRYVGYAQSALASWSAGSEAPVAIRLVRALVAQFLHDFEGALKELDTVLAADPGNVDALSYRAIIHLVKADYEKARADCISLQRKINGLVAAACLPTVDAVTGKSKTAMALLSHLLNQHPAAPRNEKSWVLNRLAESAQRLGLAREADAYYRQALALGIEDQYLLATYAEFLLDQNRPAEVVTLLQAHIQNDVLLLRLALAEKALGLRSAARHQNMLADRFAANRQRGDKLHLADEAIYYLQFTNDPATGLKLALENWAQLQREPSDARLLLEAALAAQNLAAAKPALDWLEQSGHEDLVIRRLATKIKPPAADKK